MAGKHMPTTLLKGALAKKIGRPSKYRPAYCQQLLTYMRRGGKVVTKPTVVSVGNNGGSEIVDHPLGRLPAFFEGFAGKIGVTVQTLHEWKAVHPAFFEAYNAAKAIQLQQMVDGGMAGTYQQAALIFALKNMHGWRDYREDAAEVAVTIQVVQYGVAPSVDSQPVSLTNGNGRH